MTTRIYYTDSMTRTFEATVLACDPAPPRIEVVVDRTAFYPTSGGQPFDTGLLGGVRVLDVIDRENGDVAHVVETSIPVGQLVTGEIDWARRFDHMQQHTGQHVLSAAFDRLHRARTVSFHLGADTSTIDLTREVTPAEIVAAELEASRVVWDDGPVTVRFASEQEAARLPLRKEPARAGTLRLVEVGDFDLSACGGTHVPRTGMVGLIAVTGWERFKGGTRVSFVCGGRALRSHAQLREVVISATRLLSVGAGELPAAIERLQGETKSLTRRIRELDDEAAGHRAEDLRARAETIRGWRVVLSNEPRFDAAALKALAVALVAEPGFVTILVGDGHPAPVVVARSMDVALDAGAWMKRATQALGGRGGGRPEHAQGGVTASADRILAFARETLGG